MDKFIVGLFDDDEVLLKAVGAVRKAGMKIHDVLTPYPVHGLDSAMGIKESRLHTVGFIAGAVGGLSAISFIIWANTASYPLNIGGKPFAAIPAYIPVTFEVTVLSASVTMVIAFFARCGFSLVKEPRIFDERITDDRHAMVFAFDEANAAKVRELLQQNGAVEIKEKSFES
jgi:hypothetical protein